MIEQLIAWVRPTKEPKASELQRQAADAREQISKRLDESKDARSLARSMLREMAEHD